MLEVKQFLIRAYYYYTACPRNEMSALPCLWSINNCLEFFQRLILTKTIGHSILSSSFILDD